VIQGKIKLTYKCGHTAEGEYGSAIGTREEVEDRMRSDALRRLCYECKVGARQYRLTTVGIDDLFGEPLEAWIIDNERWNGWVMPYFTKEQAEIWFERQRQVEGATVEFDEAKDAYITVLGGNDEESDDWPGMDLMLGGEMRHVYPIGAGCWTWDEQSVPEYKCPKCGKSDALDVQASIWVRLLQDDPDNLETDLDEAANHDQEWGGEDPMLCCHCGHRAQVDGFRNPNAKNLS